MYDAKDEDKRNFAKSIMDETTTDLSEISKTISDRTLEALKELRSWQRVLITLIFAVLGAMAPIFYATGKLPPHKLTFLSGLGLLLFDGIYLLNKQLRTIEQDLMDLPVSMSVTSTLMRDRLDAARKAYLEPTDENLVAIMNSGQKVIDNSGNTLQEVAEKERPAFTNDIAIGSFVMALVLLMRGFISSEMLFWLLFVALLSYFVIKALRDVGKLKKIKVKKLEDIAVLRRSVRKKRK